MTRSDPQLKIRLPSALKEQIEESAKNNKRSMNAEIVDILEAHFSYIESLDSHPYLHQEKTIEDPLLRRITEAQNKALLEVLRAEGTSFIDLSSTSTSE